MEKHVTLLGSLFVAYGILQLLIAGVVFVGTVGGGFVSGDPDAIRITSFVGTGVGSFLAVLAVPTLAAGAGLLKRKRWSRVLAMVLGGLNLLSVPFGTALGIYTLWVLFQDDTTRILA